MNGCNHTCINNYMLRNVEKNRKTYKKWFIAPFASLHIIIWVKSELNQRSKKKHLFCWPHGFKLGNFYIDCIFPKVFWLICIFFIIKGITLPFWIYNIFFLSQQKKHFLWKVHLDETTLTQNNWGDRVRKVSPTEYC